MSHFAAMCRKKNLKLNNSKKINDTEQLMQELFIDNILTVNSVDNIWIKAINIEINEIEFKLRIGAKDDVLSCQFTKTCVCEQLKM